MSVTLTVERYDQMQKELATLREVVGGHREGKIWIETRYDMFGGVRRLALPSEVVEALDKELLERYLELEKTSLPKGAKKKIAWWHKVAAKLKDTETDN